MTWNIALAMLHSQAYPGPLATADRTALSLERLYLRKPLFSKAATQFKTSQPNGPLHYQPRQAQRASFSLFKDAGDTTGMPSKISDVQIYGLLNSTNLTYKLFSDNIALHAHASAIVQDHVPLSTGYRIEPLSRSYFQPPQIGVSFRDSSSPAVINFMSLSRSGITRMYQ